MRCYYYICVICCLTLCENIIQGTPHTAFLTSNLPQPIFHSGQTIAPTRNARLQHSERVLIPPDFRYRAYGKVNITVIDSGGLPWYCYTGQQIRCVPLFKLPGRWRTTRFPNIYSPSTPPNPNKARSTTTTTTPTTAFTTSLLLQEETTPMTTAARFRSTPDQIVTQSTKLNRELNYSKPGFEKDYNFQNELEEDQGEPRSIPEATFSKLITVATKKETSRELNTRKSQPIQSNNNFLKGMTDGGRSTVIKFKKTIQVIDKGGQHLNFTTEKFNDSLKLTRHDASTYTKLNIHHLNGSQEHNSDDSGSSNNDYKNDTGNFWGNLLGIEEGSGAEDRHLEEDFRENFLTYDDPKEDNEIPEIRNNHARIDWSNKKFPNFPSDSNFMLTSSFKITNSSTSTSHSNERDGSVAESINQFIYTKFVKPNQVRTI